MDIKLLVLDIDGTIAGKSNNINQSVQNAVQEAMLQGVQVAIATGRMYNSALRFHRCLGSELPILAYNGAWIQNPLSGEIQQHLPVPQPLALRLLDYFEQTELRQDVDVHCYLDDQLYVRQITSQTENYSQRSGAEAVAVGDLRTVLDDHPTKVLALCEKPELMQRLCRELPQLYSQELYLTQSTPIYFEATHIQANKGSATRYLTENILGLRPENVMAIGDNFNDISMLKYASFSVAMGNGPSQVQELADWVAPTVEEDGVAVAIEKFILSRRRIDIK